MVSTRRTTRNDSFEKNLNAEPLSKIRKPLAGPPSIFNVFIMLISHLCKKILFVDTQIRILAYLILLFALSGVFDVTPRPKIIFPFINNFLNAYFVKLGWFWTLFVSTPFVFMTSFTYCCGKKTMLCKHLIRLGIATMFWYFWTNVFMYIEGMYGVCKDRRDLKLKANCVGSGSIWRGFDLSGHAFILIYSNLVLIEEARPILGWEFISDFIRDEIHARDNKLNNFGPLRNLNNDEFTTMHKLYERFLPFVRLNLVAITCISIIWDVMLISTIIHFHTMPEKLISGLIAMSVWVTTYKCWYENESILPLSPGDGFFKYYKADVRN